MIGAAMRTAARRVPFRMVARSGGMHARCLSLSDPATIDPSMLADVPGGIQLLVCDMAGTTVNEAGLVYIVLRESMHDAGLTVSEGDMHEWHGAGKSEVVGHFATREGASDSAIRELEAKINATFEDRLHAAYMAEGSPLALIDPTLPAYFESLRASGVKVGLNTGYPRVLQSAILKKLHMEEMVDGYCSAQARPRSPARACPY